MPMPVTPRPRRRLWQAQYDARLKAANAEGDRIIQNATRQAQEREEAIVHEAQEKAARTMERAHAQVEREKKQATNDLKDQVSGMAIGIASAVLEEDVDKRKHAKLIDSFIENLGRAPMIRASDYGRALFELARQEHREGEIGEEMAGVRAILEQQPAYARLLDSPALPREQRLSLVEEAFSSLNLYHLNFLKILCEKHAVKQYAACARVYGQLYDQAHGILRATAMTAVAMSKGQQAALAKKLEAMTGKTVKLTNVVDARILGGVTLRFAGVQLDGSLQARLEALRQSLAAATV